MCFIQLMTMVQLNFQVFGSGKMTVPLNGLLKERMGKKGSVKKHSFYETGLGL